MLQEYVVLERKLAESYCYARLTSKANVYKMIRARYMLIPNYANRITGLGSSFSSLKSPERVKISP